MRWLCFRLETSPYVYSQFNFLAVPSLTSDYDARVVFIVEWGKLLYYLPREDGSILYRDVGWEQQQHSPRHFPAIIPT